MSKERMLVGIGALLLTTITVTAGVIYRRAHGPERRQIEMETCQSLFLDSLLAVDPQTQRLRAEQAQACVMVVENQWRIKE